MQTLTVPAARDRLDDVTALFMLRITLAKAEEWSRRGELSGEAAAAYLTALDEFAKDVQKRAGEGTVTRSADYTMQEFSDPVYIASYLTELRQNWGRLL